MKPQERVQQPAEQAQAEQHPRGEGGEEGDRRFPREQGEDVAAREAEGEVQPEFLFAAAEQECRRIGEHERHDRGEHGAERDEQRADEVGILLLQDGDDVAEDHVVDGKDGRDGQHDGDEIDQVTACLPPHVAHRELKEHRLHPPKKRPS